MVSVTSAELTRSFERYRELAQREPVIITNHGRDSLVLLSSDEYQRLKQRDREAVAAEDLSDAELDTISRAEVPEDHTHLDAEVADWKP